MKREKNPAIKENMNETINATKPITTCTMRNIPPKMMRGNNKSAIGNQRGSVSTARMIKPMIRGAANKRIIGKKNKNKGNKSNMIFLLLYF